LKPSSPAVDICDINFLQHPSQQNGKTKTTRAFVMFKNMVQSSLVFAEWKDFLDSPEKEKPSWISSVFFCLFPVPPAVLFMAHGHVYA